MKMTPNIFKFLINIYPPYLGAGIKILYISKDWREIHVSMSKRWYNKNAVGTHFGGSLYSMVDPHLMLLLMQLLGKKYLVWDKSASIEFIKASKQKVKAEIKISDDSLQEIIEKTKNGEKFFANFTIDIIDKSDDLVARVEKVLYIRKKMEAEK
ncbi:MAG: tetrameric acyl-CoA thioesterase [Deltaproteobacteria bacterium]|nr:MAG: tetrameric acyl-CoA thioesterase [Deltaproteobacteria bacterium]